MNRAAPFRVVEVYCEVDTGRALINLQIDGLNILTQGLECTSAGASSSTVAVGNETVRVGQKTSHVTISSGTGIHRMNVVVKYVVD